MTGDSEATVENTKGFVRFLLADYPRIDLMGFDASNPSAAARAVLEDETGDTLFTFLWHELSDADSLEEASDMLEGALRDIEVVVDALESLAGGGSEGEAAPGEAKPHVKAFLESYPNIDLLPIDAPDPKAIEKAVENAETGDTLFSFIWRELVAAQDVENALSLLSQAIDDIIAVLGPIEAQILSVANAKGDSDAAPSATAP